MASTLGQAAFLASRAERRFPIPADPGPLGHITSHLPMLRWSVRPRQPSMSPAVHYAITRGFSVALLDYVV